MVAFKIFNLSSINDKTSIRSTRELDEAKKLCKEYFCNISKLVLECSIVMKKTGTVEKTVSNGLEFISTTAY